MKKQLFTELQFVNVIGKKEIHQIEEVEYFQEADDYVYYTTTGQSFGDCQLEPLETVYEREMSITNEEIIEEILIEANSYGLRQEVLDWAKSLMDADPRMDKVDAYQLAYHELIK
jgi:hypothetical protein